jgi:thiol-disulfide isomerase/thioredoxin
MRKLIFVFVFIAIQMVSASANAQKISYLKFQSLEERILKHSDTTFVINFFASWCAPCIAELPDVLSFAKEQSNQKIATILLSLDFKKDVAKQLIPVMKKLNYSGDVYVLDETNANTWINRVDSTWEGSIPATWIFNSSKKYSKLIAQPVSKTDLNSSLHEIKN